MTDGAPSACRRFCVMTIGRCGSTSLMEAIGGLAGVAVPARDMDCPDSELVHPRRLAQAIAAYEAIAGRRIAGQDDLIEAFFAAHPDASHAGFKSMPERHPDFAAFARRPDVRFITLARRDVAATAASFLVAKATGQWRRGGGAPDTPWRYDRARSREALRGILAYVAEARRRLSEIPAAIRLDYEDLCDPGSSSPALDAFFGARVRLRDPSPPVSARDRIEDWGMFDADFRALWTGHRQ